MPADNGDYGSIFNPASDAAQGRGAFTPRVLSVTNNQPMGGAGYGNNAASDALLARSASNAYNQARTDSLARRDKMLSLASQFGASQLTNSQNLYNQQVAQQGNTLTGRGLSNSTVVDSLRQGAGQAMSQRNQSIGEQQAQMQLGVYGQVQEQYPDMNMLAQLFSQPRAPGSTAALAGLFGGAGGAGGGAGGAGSASILRGR
jgi:hypothetical protein